MIYGYPNFGWSSGNSTTDGYTNEEDDESEYENRERVQE